jgi:hypothetical protein
MADTNEFQAARIDGDNDSGPQLITKWAALEASCRNIFGITADTDYAAAFAFGTGPNITMQQDLTLRSAAPTADLHACPKNYLQGLGGGFGDVRARAYLTSNLSFAGGSSSTYIEWDAADINEGTMWESGNPTRLTVPTGEGGHYMAGFSMSFDANVAGTDSQAWWYIEQNRADFEGGTGRYNLHHFESENEDEVGVSGLTFIRNASAGDYFELRMYPRFFGDCNVYKANTTFWAFKVSA